MDVNYKMEDTVLGTTVKEKDLGVTISTDMKISEQRGIAASRWCNFLQEIAVLRMRGRITSAVFPLCLKFFI